MLGVEVNYFDKLQKKNFSLQNINFLQKMTKDKIELQDIFQRMLHFQNASHQQSLFINNLQKKIQDLELVKCDYCLQVIFQQQDYEHNSKFNSGSQFSGTHL